MAFNICFIPILMKFTWGYLTKQEQKTRWAEKQMLEKTRTQANCGVHIQ